MKDLTSSFIPGHRRSEGLLQRRQEHWGYSLQKKLNETNLDIDVYSLYPSIKHPETKVYPPANGEQITAHPKVVEYPLTVASKLGQGNFF